MTRQPKRPRPVNAAARPPSPARQVPPAVARNPPSGRALSGRDQQLARTCPNELEITVPVQQLHCRTRDWNRIASGIGYATRKKGNITAGAHFHRLAHFLYLLQSHYGRNVQFYTPLRKPANERGRWASKCVGNRNLDVNVCTPACDFERLLFHLAKLIGEHFKGDGAIRNACQNLPRKGLIIANTRLPHQRRIGRESRNQRIPIQSKHLAWICAIGKDLHSEMR